LREPCSPLPGTEPVSLNHNPNRYLDAGKQIPLFKYKMMLKKSAILRQISPLFLITLLGVGLPFAASSASAAIPRGVFSLGSSGKPTKDAVLDNPDVTGISIRYGWNDLEPTEGNFYWDWLDAEVARATAAGKQVLLRIGTQSGKPDWVTAAVQRAGGKFFTWENDGVTTSIPVFWDPTYLTKKKNMIAAVGAHFTNNKTITIVTASFANASSEDWNVPHTPDLVTEWFSLGYTSEKMLNAGQQIINATMTAFPNQYVALAIGNNGHVGATGNLDPTADYVARTTCEWAWDAWPGRLVTQINSLSTVIPEAPGDEFSAWAVLWDMLPQVGAQMLFHCVNDPDYQMNGGVPLAPSLALTKAINLGLAYRLRYMEIYQIDVVNLPGVITYAQENLL